MNPDEHAAAVNRRAQLQSKLAIVEALEKNKPGDHLLLSERSDILKELSALETKFGFHFAEQDSLNPRAQI